MPDDRFLHKRAGQSEKVSQLSDLEFRVWTQYLLSADDFGVMRLSALTIQADNAALELRPIKAVTAALNKIVTVRLLQPFVHQNRAYVYQHNWQDWQKVTYPRQTIEPKPPVEICTRNMQWLLSYWPGGKPVPSWKAPERFTCEVVEVFPEDLGKVSEKLSKSFSEPLAVSPLPLAIAVDSSSEVNSEPASPGVLTFPTVGAEGNTWQLSEAQVAEWATLFPHLDVLGESRKALAWVIANEGRRKTPRGMAKFLVAWFSRATDNGRGHASAAKPAPLMAQPVGKRLIVPSHEPL